MYMNTHVRRGLYSRRQICVYNCIARAIANVIVLELRTASCVSVVPMPNVVSQASDSKTG